MATPARGILSSSSDSGGCWAVVSRVMWITLFYCHNVIAVCVLLLLEWLINPNSFMACSSIMCLFISCGFLE